MSIEQHARQRQTVVYHSLRNFCSIVLPGRFSSHDEEHLIETPGQQQRLPKAICGRQVEDHGREVTSYFTQK